MADALNQEGALNQDGIGDGMIEVAAAPQVEVTDAPEAEIELAQARRVTLARPAAGQTAEPMTIGAGDQIVVSFPPTQADVQMVGRSLVFTFADGGKITISNFGAVDPLPSLIMPNGAIVAGGVVVAQLTGAAAAVGLETAAGPAGAIAGGEHTYGDDYGHVIQMLGPQGPIPLVSLGFTAPEAREPHLAAAPDARDFTLIHDETRGLQGDGQPQDDEDGSNENDVDPPLPPELQCIVDELENCYPEYDLEARIAEYNRDCDCLQAMGVIPHASGETVSLDPVGVALYSGDVGVDSGLFTNGTDDPHPIHLFDFGDGVIVGLEAFVYDGGEGETCVEYGDMVFIAYIDSDTGEVWFVQCGAINHDDPYDPDEAFPAEGTVKEALHLTYTLSNGGGEDSANLTIEIQDDGPTLCFDFVPNACIWEEVCETWTSGYVGIDYGTDGPGKIADLKFIVAENVAEHGEEESGNVPLTSQGRPLFYVEEACGGGARVLTAYALVDDGEGGWIQPPVEEADAIFTVKMYVNGYFTFTLLDQLDHPDAGETGSCDELKLSFCFVAQDGDEDGVPGLFTVTVKDDGPEVAYQSEPVSGFVEEDGMSLATGDLSEGNKQGGDTNADDEDQGGAGSLGSLYLTGADEPLTFGLNSDTSDLPMLKSKGQLVTYAVSDSDIDGVLDTVTASAGGRVVFTLKVNTDGSWNFDLHDQLDHVGGDGENTALQLWFGGSVDFIDFSSILVAKDFDGDPAPSLLEGSFRITVQDDVPTALDDTDRVLAGHTTHGNVLTGVDPDVAGTPADSSDNGAQVADLPGADEPSTVIALAGGFIGVPLVTSLGTLTLNADGSYTYVAKVGVLGTDSFTYTMHDGSDQSQATLTINVGGLVVGSNDDDDQDSDTEHTVPNLDGPGSGPIQGGDGDDVLLGDKGGASESQASTANFILVLDSSGSMTTNISFGGGNISREQALKNAVNHALDTLAGSGAANVRVQIVDFDTNASSLGVFDIIIGGVVQVAALAAAHAAVNGMDADGFTNYEAGLQQAVDFIGGGGGGPLAGADVNKLLFVSDGEPNRAFNANGTTVGSFSADNSIAHVLGTYNPAGTSSDDTVSEVGVIEAAGFTIELIGINVGAGALSLLSQVEGAGGSADNITTAEQLDSVIGSLFTGSILDPVGADLINGGAGNDLLMGDVPNTDALNAALGVGDLPGSGWQVFTDLLGTSPGSDPAGDGAVWTADDTIAYLKNPANLGDLSAGDRGEADIMDGGAGDDTMIGQGGDDTLTGGTGNDTFVYNLGADQGEDTITDFHSGDKLSFVDVVDGPDGGVGIGDNISDAVNTAIAFSKAADVVTFTLQSGTVIHLTDLDNVINSYSDLAAHSVMGA